MKTIKRTALILSIMLLAVMCFAFSASAEDLIFGDYNYTVLEDGTVKITDYTGTEVDVVIPGEIDGKAVAVIGSYAFNGEAKLASVVIPGSVKEIERQGVYGCEKLTSVTVAEGALESLYNTSFENCRALKTVSLPSNVVSIGSFMGCTALEKITVDEANTSLKSVDGIVYSADMKTLVKFPQAKKLDKYTIPATVEVISANAFYEVTGTVNVYIPLSVKTIDELAFAYSKVKIFYEGSSVPASFKAAFNGRTVTLNAFPLGKPEKVTSTQTTSTIKLDWTAVSGAAGYKIYYKTATGWKDLGNTTKLSVTYKNLKPGAKYTFAVRAGRIVNGKTEWASGYTVHETATQATVISKVTAAQNTSAVQLTWTASAGATGYRIYLKDGNVWKTALSTTNKTTHTFTGLKAGSKLTYAVRPYVKNGSAVIWSNFVQIDTGTKAVAPAKVTAKQSTSEITLSWTDCAGATGYRIFYKSGNDWKVTVSTTAKTSHTFTGLKAGAKFTFAVRPYVKNGSTVIWSDYKTYTAATTPAATKVTVNSTLGGQAVVSWNAVSGANGYQLYFKVNNGAYKLYKEYPSAQKLTFNGLQRGATYTFVVRAFVNTSGGKVLSGYKEAPVKIAYKIDRYNKVFESGNFLMQVNDPDLGIVTTAIKNGNLYMETTAEGIALKMLYTKSKGQWYLIMDDFKMYSIMPESMVGDLDVDKLINNMRIPDNQGYTVSTVKIGGKNYDCESFKDESGITHRYCFSGDTLVYSQTIAKDGTVSTTEFKKVASNPSNSYFSIPAGYSYINLDWVFATM